MTLKQIERFHKEDCSLWFSFCIFKISWTFIITNFFSPLLISNLCYKLLQIKNVFQ